MDTLARALAAGERADVIEQAARERERAESVARAEDAVAARALADDMQRKIRATATASWRGCSRPARPPVLRSCARNWVGLIRLRWRGRSRAWHRWHRSAGRRSISN
jgi:hypothetical protein